MTPGFLNALSRQERARAGKAKPAPGAWDFDKPSRAVIASDGTDGVVLWWVGGDLWAVFESGVRSLEELGLDDAPHGLSVWEGHYVNTVGGDPESSPDVEPKGTFRDLDDDEAAAVLERRNPWDPAEWKMGARRTT